MKKVFFCLAMIIPILSMGQNNPQKEVHLEQIDVVNTTNHIASDALRIVRTLSKIEIATLPVQNLNELLDYLPGIDVRTRGSDGVQADVSMRGGTFDQVLILLNGINITDPQTGHYSMDIPIDLSMIERIEILQGTSMHIFGLSAFSGAINIITGNTDQCAVKTGLTGGGYGYFAPHVGVNYHSKKWTFSGSLSHHQSTGYIENTDFKNSNLFLQTTFNDTLAGLWNFQVGGQLKNYGANSFYSLSYPNQYEITKTLIASLSWEKHIGSFVLEATAFYRTHYDQFQLFRDKENAAPWYKYHNHHITHVVGGNTKTAWYSKIGKTEVGIEVRNERIVSNVLGDRLSKPQKLPSFVKEDSTLFIFGKNRLNINYFIEQSFFIHRFSASIGVSGNYNTLFHHHFCMGANLGYRYAQNGTIYANINRSLRLPTFTDLYYQSATQVSNPNLKPEESLTIEIGTNWRNYGFKIHAAVFYRMGKNIIDWAKKTEASKWFSMNIDRVDALGGEVSVGYHYGYWLKNIELSYAHCTLNKASGELISKYALDYLKHKISFNLEHGIYKEFGACWQLSYQYRAGGYFDRSGQSTRYRPFWLLNARLYWQNKILNIYVEAENLTHTHYYDYGGIEQAGFWLKIGIQVKLGLKN